MPTDSRPVFDSYELPLPRRGEGGGRAAALSFLAHLTIAILVLWRGAALFESGGGGGTGPRGGGGGGGRPAVSWFTLPSVSTPQAHDVPPAPAVTVPTAAVPVPEPVKLDLPPPSVVITPPAAVGTGAGTSGGPGQGPGSGGGIGAGTGTGVGVDSGPGSGGGKALIIPASPKWAIIPPDGLPRGRYEVRFWVNAEGVVNRVEVTPPIKDSEYRREFTKRMMGYLFNPATTRDGQHVDYVATVVFTK
ncbi:MAG: hypothetical protein ACM358_13865 [Gemmatimonadota bacterium]